MKRLVKDISIEKKKHWLIVAVHTHLQQITVN